MSSRDPALLVLKASLAAFELLELVPCLVTGYLVVALSIPPQYSLDVEELRERLDREVPNGSTREAAEDWLRRNHLLSGRVVSGKPDSVVGLYGTVRDNSGQHQSEVQVHVYFDPDGFVTKRSVVRREYLF